MKLKEHQIANRAAWQEFAAKYVEPAEDGWSSNNPRWGIWHIPDNDIGLLPKNLDGKRCIEIGCGAGYVSSWMARRGAKSVVGIDPTPNQLATARRLEAQYQLGVDFVEGFGESLPFDDACFDFAISEYGASLWADPYRWIPEAARVLRPGGGLVFMTNHAFAICCVPDQDDDDAPLAEQLQRPYLGLYQTQWKFSSNEVEFHLPHGEWIALLAANEFAVERLLELGAPTADAGSNYGWADASWATKWPTEEVWSARRL